MPVTVTTENDLRPIYQAKPNMRFATTFISNKYRDYAVNGETLMDKATGEIFTKRPEDGRVVSFFQNKKYMSDLMLDLRVMLNNNASFTYPEEMDATACYLSTDYDMMSLYENRDISITESDQIIPDNKAITSTQIRFYLSKKTNGFFCRLTSRDADKAAIEYITNQYNAICKGYTGTDEDFKTESRRFTSIEKWEDSNAVIHYDVYYVKNGNTNMVTLTDYIRINEESCLLFPQGLLQPSTLLNSDHVYAVIKSIEYPKIRFLMDRIDELPTFNEGLQKFIYPDKNIFIRYCNICNFVDSSDDIELLGNEFIVAMADVPYVRRHMMKMGKLVTESSIYLSASRPSDDVWGTNTIWAEHVRDVFKNGKVIYMECEVDLKMLEMYISENDNTDFVMLSEEGNDRDMYGIREV